jgi:predicted N-acetyltransferase YhbS
MDDAGRRAQESHRQVGAPRAHAAPRPARGGAVRIRSFAGPGDIDGMTAADNAWSSAIGILERVSAESMRAQFAHATTCDPVTDCVVAELDGAIVGYARVDRAGARDGDSMYRSIPTAAPGPGRLVTVDLLVDWVVERAVAIAAGGEAQQRQRLVVFAADVDADLIGACERRGFAPVRRWYEMGRPDLDQIPDAPLPDSLEIRPVRPEHLRSIWEAAVEAFRDHWGWSGGTEGDWERFRDDPTADPTLWRVAWDRDEVAGQVRSYIDTDANEEMGRLVGWTENISVRHRWRGRGLARALLADSLRAVRDRGMSEAALDVDGGNELGAVGLYESLGFVVRQTYIIFERPLP